MLLHKSYINLAIPVILDLVSSLYDLPVQICQISTRVALSISVKNLFFANISKSKPQMMLHKSLINLAIAVITDLFLCLNDLTTLSDIIITDYILTDTCFHGHNYSRSRAVSGKFLIFRNAKTNFHLNE